MKRTARAETDERAESGRKGGKQRAKNLTAKQRHAAAVVAGIASGAARMTSVSPAVRKKSAQMAARARWAKAKKT